MALLLVAPAIAAGSYPKVADYALDMTFFPEKASLSGLASITFAHGDNLMEDATFFLHGELRVDSVLSGNQAVEYDQERVLYKSDYSMIANEVTLDLSNFAARDQLHVYYRGYFNPSKARSPSDYMRIDEDGVFLRSYDYSVWFPVFLKERQDSYEVDFSDVKIRTPEEFHSVFVGQHVGDEIVDGLRVSHWKASSVDLFLAQCTSQRFEITSVGGFHAYHWKDSLSGLAAPDIIKIARELAERFKEQYNHSADAGEYYFMQMPRYGDISSGNVTGICGEGWQDFAQDEWAVSTLAHEMVHPFVNVGVDRSDPLYALMIESFPSYFHKPILAQMRGEQAYRESLVNLEKRYLTSKVTGLSRRGRKLPPEKPIDQITSDEVGRYKDYFILSDRAPLFLNYLKVKMGDESFGKFTRQLFNDGPMTNVRFRALIREFAPKIDDDVTVWLSTNDYPERFHLTNLMPGIAGSP